MILSTNDAVSFHNIYHAVIFMSLRSCSKSEEEICFVHRPALW
jgi:hypothetical protein